ncbi:MAG: DNA-binding protein [Nanoarchaeota archaeon]|nr:DNA-binding protein [Nanoarchaeota archaeon]MBU4124215.1 DNA-binding protein [Nanoarchaeota archaeon]
MLDKESMQRMEEVKSEILKKMMTREAFERLSRVRLGNQTVASQLEAYLLQVYQTGQLNEKIDDNKLKQILEVLIGEKKKTKIKKKRK